MCVGGGGGAGLGGFIVQIIMGLVSRKTNQEQFCSDI